MPQTTKAPASLSLKAKPGSTSQRPTLAPLKHKPSHSRLNPLAGDPHLLRSRPVLVQAQQAEAHIRPPVVSAPVLAELLPGRRGRGRTASLHGSAARIHAGADGAICWLLVPGPHTGLDTLGLQVMQSCDQRRGWPASGAHCLAA